MRKIFSMNKLKNKSVPKIRILFMAVSLSVILSMVPNHSAFAAESDRFVTAAKANHWGRSDLRAYLNNGLADVAEDGTVNNKNYGIDSTTGVYESDNKSGYAKQFSNAEYNIIQPFTYSTNVLDGAGGAVSTYTTTDKFWLPSANSDGGKDQIISFGSDDISSESQYSQTTQNDKQRIIPIAYWSYGASNNSFLRSSYYGDGKASLAASRGSSVNNIAMNETSCALAVAFKIDISNVNFASSASAASIVGENDEGAKKIEIAGSTDWQKKTLTSLPDYGMYLKTADLDDNRSFRADSLSLTSLNGTALTVAYTGSGLADRYVVVQAFKEDRLTENTISYVAAKKLNDSDNLISIDVSAWNLASLDGYTIKVWMEDGSESLAKATEPVTFYGMSSSIYNTGTEVTNPRVFAMKADLQTSWGDLSQLSDDDYNKVISGNVTSANGGVTGVLPTNQKIYFGSQEFWIAGRETVANGGTISADGDIMTLYQAKSVKKKGFNASEENYKETITVSLQDDQSVIYTGSPAVYSGTVTYQNGEGNGFTPVKPDLTYQYSTDNGTTWMDGMPTADGTYQIRVIVAANNDYESAMSAPVCFTIEKKVTYTVPVLQAKEVYYGAKLGNVYSEEELKELLGVPKVNVNTEISGSWSWVDGTEKSTGDKGTKTFQVQFTPDAEMTDRFEWDAVTGWDSTAKVIKVDVPVNVKALPIGDDAKITLDKSEFVYNGKAQMPTVTVKNGSTILKENTDYTITWPADITNVGTKKITINFKGNYSGTIETQYTIKKAEKTSPVKKAADKGKVDTKKAVKTGDEITDLEIFGLGLSMILTLGFMLSSIKNRKKYEDTAR